MVAGLRLGGSGSPYLPSRYPIRGDRSLQQPTLSGKRNHAVVQNACAAHNGGACRASSLSGVASAAWLAESSAGPDAMGMERYHRSARFAADSGGSFIRNVAEGDAAIIWIGALSHLQLRADRPVRGRYRTSHTVALAKFIGFSAGAFDDHRAMCASRRQVQHQANSVEVHVQRAVRDHLAETGCFSFHPGPLYGGIRSTKCGDNTRWTGDTRSGP